MLASPLLGKKTRNPLNPKKEARGEKILYEIPNCPPSQKTKIFLDFWYPLFGLSSPNRMDDGGV